MIEATALTKRYGEKLAVDDLSFTVQPGLVTGFLGPNGAGKSTTMRMILGLDRPTSGSVTVNGKAYAEHRSPMHEVGALLEAKAAQGDRSARDHLLALAATSGIGKQRVAEVIEMVGLGSVAKQRARGFSLGMGQRLGIAVALLGDPRTLILDEPVNGLDPDGVRWIRHLLTDLAHGGRTILLSSHLMSEMALTADRVIVIGRGRLLRDEPMADFIASAQSSTVRVRSPQAAELGRILAADGATVSSSGEDGVLRVDDLTCERVGTLAAEHGLTVYELTPGDASLEDAYMALTRDATDFRDTRPVRDEDHEEVAA